MCDVCHYRCSPEERVDEDVVVWRCEKDKRRSGGELVGPGAAKTREDIELSENQVSSNSQFFPVSNKTDQGSQAGDGEVTSAGKEGQSGGAPANMGRCECHVKMHRRGKRPRTDKYTRPQNKRTIRSKMMIA